MKVIVLGAGVVGITSAWYLAHAGHEVTVIDRQSGAGMETSFANGGQISVSHAEPWANPTAPLKLLQWLGREDAPLLFRPRADAAQWSWALRFLFECLPWRAHANTEQAFALALYSRERLQALRRDTGIEYKQATRGILHFYTEAHLFERAHKEAEMLRARGFDAAVKTPEQCVSIEPALAGARNRLHGGTYTPSDESGDAHVFTRELARMAAERGVVFRWNAVIRRLVAQEGEISGVAVESGLGDECDKGDKGDKRNKREDVLRADAYVLALGSYSPLLLAPIGLSLPIYPVKGYSITLPLEPGDVAPQVSLTDHERKIVFSRLGDRLRVAGTAELNGYNTEINAARCDALLTRIFELFPRAGRAAEAKRWTGLRPATPSNLPYIGRSRYPNLYLNSGHGTLGWTMACGSGQAIADIVDGRRPDVNFRFLGLAERSIAVSTAAPSVPRT